MIQHMLNQQKRITTETVLVLSSQTEFQIYSITSTHLGDHNIMYMTLYNYFCRQNIHNMLICNMLYHI